MYVRVRDGANAHLGTVRDLLTEAEETDANGPIKGLRATAARAVATGHPRIASLAARFIKESRSNTDIVSTADTHTRWLLDDRIRADLAKNGIDFATLKDAHRWRPRRDGWPPAPRTIRWLPTGANAWLPPWERWSDC
jgi:type IV secretory pathway TraG/TraD family ATPase VirD4